MPSSSQNQDAPRPVHESEEGEATPTHKKESTDLEAEKPQSEEESTKPPHSSRQGLLHDISNSSMKKLEKSTLFRAFESLWKRQPTTILWEKVEAAQYLNELNGAFPGLEDKGSKKAVDSLLNKIPETTKLSPAQEQDLKYIASLLVCFDKDSVWPFIRLLSASGISVAEEKIILQVQKMLFPNDKLRSQFPFDLDQFQLDLNLFIHYHKTLEKDGVDIKNRLLPLFAKNPNIANQSNPENKSQEFEKKFPQNAHSSVTGGVYLFDPLLKGLEKEEKLKTTHSNNEKIIARQPHFIAIWDKSTLNKGFRLIKKMGETGFTVIFNLENGQPTYYFDQTLLKTSYPTSPQEQDSLASLKKFLDDPFFFCYPKDEDSSEVQELFQKKRVKKQGNNWVLVQSKSSS